MWYVLGFLLLLALGQAVFFSMQAGETIAYSDFKDAVRAGTRAGGGGRPEDRVRGAAEARGRRTRRSRSTPSASRTRSWSRSSRSTAWPIAARSPAGGSVRSSAG